MENKEKNVNNDATFEKITKQLEVSWEMEGYKLTDEDKALAKEVYDGKKTVDEVVAQLIENAKKNNKKGQ